MKSGPHIVSAFDDDLIAIEAKISEMGGLAEDMLTRTIDALEKWDVDMARQIFPLDDRLDQLERDTEEMTRTTIALRQPMAQDLRLLLSALKIATTLERIGDLSENIARRVVSINQHRPVKVTSSLVRMGRQTLAHLSEVLDAHISRDKERAKKIWLRDVEIDESYNAIFREVVTYMMEDQRMIGAGSQLLFLAKNLERIGDHTTHIAETVYYIVDGEYLGDDRPKGGPIGLEY